MADLERSSVERPVYGPRMVIISEMEESSEESRMFTSEEDEACFAEEHMRITDVPSEYWHIQKLIKYMKAGNQTATIVSLACLKDHDLTTEVNQLAIKDIGGLEVLTNLLETDDLKCKLGALYILKELTTTYDVRKTFTDLGGVPLLLDILSDQARDLQTLASETLANVARIRKARMIVRKSGGLPKIVDLLDVSQTALTTPWNQLSIDDKELVQVAKGAAKALWSLSKSKRNREAMRKAGIVRLLARVLKSCHSEVIVPIMGTIQQCANEASYQLAIQTEGMIGQLVRHLSAESVELKTHCASAIYKCAEDETTRQLVRQHGGLDPLISLARDFELRSNKNLLAAVTGAIWKCAISRENIKRLDELFTVRILVQLLENENEEVLINVVGGLAECCKTQENREALRKAGGIPSLIQLLSWTNQPLLENVAKVLGECANDTESMELIEELDGVRLVWSLLKNPSPKVQANAAWALRPMIENAKDSGEMVRSFVGALELIVSLLKSKDNNVLACVCAAIAKVAEDKENLAVITDHGVVPMLCNLVPTTDDHLREHLASAIASCCGSGSNAFEFGKLGTLPTLVLYMAGSNKAVHRSTARALHMLSTDPYNCITLHQTGVVGYLLETIGSRDEELQASSAGCLSNIRRLALSAEKFKLTYDKCVE
ncbi:Armadillo repeat-containing protein, putative [Pediculus humanus corporis]|uniref:Armadillo repeat-containing protein, putative n=1 Tax=Pediculus humanus subsp. corporis TaxID=121224 RepID=E0VQV4_PEDHC|nr:Armadillo repeat-containing protein, putative [Pediculus humanus corporis]EEB15760.1 Armadillo repeat-containing protein, putative [Pediculus humanus corporis]